MITNINLYSLRNGEYIQLMRDILTIILKNDPDNLQVRTVYGALLGLTNDTESLFKLSQNSAITEEMTALDDRRDNAINGITFLVNGFSYSIDTVVSSSAKTLANHLGIFGTGIARDNSQSETATIRNIVNDWKTIPALQLALTTLQMDSWKTELEASNNAFNNAYIARSEEIATASTDKLKAKRAETNTAFYKLRDNINAHFTLTEESEPYSTLIKTINAIIDQYNKLLGGRVGKSPDLPGAPLPAAPTEQGTHA